MGGWEGARGSGRGMGEGVSEKEGVEGEGGDAFSIFQQCSHFGGTTVKCALFSS